VLRRLHRRNVIDNPITRRRARWRVSPETLCVCICAGYPAIRDLPCPEVASPYIRLPLALAGKRGFMRGMYLGKGNPRARVYLCLRAMEIRDEANAPRIERLIARIYQHLPAWNSANVYLRKSFSRCTAGNLHGKYGFMFHGLYVVTLRRTRARCRRRSRASCARLLERQRVVSKMTARSSPD